MAKRELFVKDTHRGLWYEDGALVRIVEAGRYVIPTQWDLRFWRRPKIEVVLVDVRERELTIKGQEILTSDKVAIRVSIVVQFKVTDPRAAIHNVERFEERLYSDVQLAARRSLASMTLEEILTNRNQLSEDILRDVKESAAGYGVAILRADVKDLIFPGNLQEIMNRVLASERKSQSDLIDARTRAEIARLESAAEADRSRAQAEAAAHAHRLQAEAEAQAQRLRTEAEIAALGARAAAADAYRDHPALMRLRELEALTELARNANARLYIGAGEPLRVGGTERDG
jgi:regulator of protease activity HflC (stomatin/prohibitin superfamily)